MWMYLWKHYQLLHYINLLDCLRIKLWSLFLNCPNILLSCAYVSTQIKCYSYFTPAVFMFHTYLTIFVLFLFACSTWDCVCVCVLHTLKLLLISCLCHSVLCENIFVSVCVSVCTCVCFIENENGTQGILCTG